MADVDIDVAYESTAQEILEDTASLESKVGSTKNTGGSATEGTVFGKLNKIISDLATHIASWTSTRAGYIDTINTNASRLTSARATKIDNIGATGDTGGSATAGTVMGKLNAIITSASNIYGKVDTEVAAIKTKTDTIGATGDTGGSATAGTVMGKLNALFSAISTTAKDWYASHGTNVTLKSITARTTIFKKANSITGDRTLFEFTPPKSGMYRFDINSVCYLHENITTYTGSVGGAHGAVFLQIKKKNDTDRNSLIPTTYKTSETFTYKGGTPNVDITIPTITTQCYLKQGRTYQFVLNGSCEEHIVIDVLSAYVLYNKTACPTL